jgi:hypothetical protein
MTAANNHLVTARPLDDGTGAIVIALIYGLVGPVVGAILIVPIATILAAEFKPSTLVESAYVILSMFPVSVPISYYLAGTLALATGIIVGAYAHRRGRAPVWLAIAAPGAVVIVLAILHWLGLDVPGAGVLRGRGPLGILFWLAVSIAASLVCWAVTLPIQRRMR